MVAGGGLPGEKVADCVHPFPVERTPRRVAGIIHDSFAVARQSSPSMEVHDGVGGLRGLGHGGRDVA